MTGDRDEVIQLTTFNQVGAGELATFRSGALSAGKPEEASPVWVFSALDKV